MSVLGDVLQQLQDQNRVLREENERLRRAVLNQCGDNLCHLTDEEIAGLRAEGRIPPWSEFGESCRRFHSQIAEHAGILQGCMTIAQLEAELQKTRDELAGCASRAVSLQDRVGER